MASTAFFLLLAALLWSAMAMRDDHLRFLRQETVDMFYHGYSNYMKHAFPEDELRPLSCGPLTRDRDDPGKIGLNDALGNYSLTLIDSLSTLAILAGGPQEGSYTGKQALGDFQDGISQFVLYYGDGRRGASGQGIRARGFDLDSKVQVFETVIRGVGGLLSAHLFAIGELPIPGYNPTPLPGFPSDDPLEIPPIKWPGGFKYDGQLLRLALDLSERLLPAFYTTTGIPYPRVNLRTGIPFYLNSPLHGIPDDDPLRPEGQPEITETCSAGAGSLTLEFTVLSRLTGDPRFEQAAKRAFWEVWKRRSDIGLIGNGIDAERGIWIGPHSGIGAGMDSFFEYALKSHILLSGHGMPNISTSRTRRSRTDWLDPNSLHPPLPSELHSSDAFLQAWHQAHASVKRYLYTDRNQFPYYSNNHRATGQPYTMWIDSLGAFYPGLLALAGEVEEAIEANLVYTALWTRYAALPERWSVRETNVEPGIGWWPGRPEFIESTYHIYRATKDPWYLRVGEMVLQDIQRRCRGPCGWAGLQDVKTGEKQDRMESFFLGETTKYMYLLFDPDHKLNKLDAAYVFTTEGHPLIIPKKSFSKDQYRKSRGGTHSELSLYQYYDENFTNSCPVPRIPDAPLAGSATAARPDLFDVSRFTDLYHTPNIHGPIEEVVLFGKDQVPVTYYKAKSNHTIFPWTLPPTMLPPNGTCAAPPDRTISWIEFPSTDTAASLVSKLGGSLVWYDQVGPTVQNLDGLRLQLQKEYDESAGEYIWKIISLGNTVLGRHETVFFHAEHVSHLKDDAFMSMRRRDIVDIVMLTEPPRPAAAEAAKDAQVNGSSISSSSTSFDEAAPPPGSRVELRGRPKASEPLFKSLLRVVTSVFDPSATDSPKASARDINANTIYTWDANMPSGVGAFPVPSISDTPIDTSPSYDATNPSSNFPWKTIFFAGQACDEPLDPVSSRKHQIIVMRRGGCSFSQKLDNIPSFPPGRLALQLVLIIDERVSNDEEPLPRPILESEQVMPGGGKRPHVVPMVLMRGEIGDYDLFRNSAGVGMRRRYRVRSQGLMIGNAEVI